MSRRKREQQSFKTDKAVADNIVESWLCIDCGVNTAPGLLSGPDLRLALALASDDDGVSQTFGGDTAEVYTVKSSLWAAAGMRAWNGCLCIGCLEKRLGRQLRPQDFDREDERAFARLPSTDRLLDRRGLCKMPFLTDEGEEREMVIDKRQTEEASQAWRTSALALRGRRAVSDTHQMKHALVCAGVLLFTTTLAGCVSSQRFAAPARQPQAVPQAVPPQTSSGPFTREREDREFGQ